MNIMIIMATMRWQHWARLRTQFLYIASTPGLRLFWMPVLYPRERDSAATEALHQLFGHHAPRWIQPLVIAEEPGVNHCIRKQNAALDRLEEMGFDGWLMTASDDNLLPHNLGKRLLQSRVSGLKSKVGHSPADDGNASRLQPPASRLNRVIVFSHKRGQHIPAPPPRDFGTSDLIAAPENMIVGKVSGEQYFVHSSLLEGFRFAHHGCCDGQLVQALHEQAPGEFRFVPDYFIPFNALEPGRWEPDELQKVLEAE